MTNIHLWIGVSAAALVIVISVTGEVLATGTRDDVFLEKLHSGEIFGDNWVLISDALAIGLVFLLLTGFWMWLYPRTRM